MKKKICERKVSHFEGNDGDNITGYCFRVWRWQGVFSLIDNQKQLRNTHTHTKCSWAMHNAISLLITCLLLLLADIWSCHWRDITFCDNYSGAVRRQFPPLDNCRCRRRCVWQQSQSSGHRGRMHPAPGQHKDVPATTRSTRGLRMYQVAGTKLLSFIRMYQVSRCQRCTRPGPNPKTFWAGWMQRRRQVRERQGLGQVQETGAGILGSAVRMPWSGHFGSSLHSQSINRCKKTNISYQHLLAP